MTLLILINILLTLTLTIITCQRPFSLILTILIIAFTIASLISIIISSWLAFILFLIYIGGLLIIFSYFLAISPNQENISILRIFIPLISLILTVSVSIILIDSITITSTQWIPLTEVIFSQSNYPILIMLILILLLVIIIVVKVTKLEKGPLRGFISYV